VYFTVQRGDEVFQLLLLPMLAPAFGLVLAVAAGFALVLLGRRWRTRYKTLSLALLPVLVAGFAVPVAMPLWTWTVSLTRTPVFNPQGPRLAPNELFLAPVLTEIGVAGATALVVAVSIAAFVARQPMGREWLACGLASTGLAMGWLLSLAGLTHASWLMMARPMPALRADTLTAEAHVGAVVEVRTEVLGGSGWVAAEPVQMTASVAGTHELPLAASHPLLRMSAIGHLDFGEELAPPWFPLRVGNRWTFERTTESTTQVVWFLPSTNRTTEPAVTVEVVGARQHGGLRIFDLEVRDDSGVVVRSVYAMNGAIHELDSAPLARVTTNDTPVEFAGAVHCETTLFPGFECICDTVGNAPGGLPGPATCIEHRSGGLGDAIVAIISLTTVIPGGERTQIVLVDTATGEQGAQEAATAPPSAR
jgi:hypothetical protein